MFRYRCGQCRTTSLPVRTRAEMLADRDLHRALVHGGHVPDGEQLLQRRRRPGDARALLWVVLLLVLPTLIWIARHMH